MVERIQLHFWSGPVVLAACVCVQACAVGDDFPQEAVSVAAQAAAAAPVCTPLPADAIAWWPGDGNSNDIVGGNTGVPQNGASFSPGLVADAFSFGVPAGMVQAPDSPALNLESLTGSTFEGWFSSTGGDGVVVAKHTCGIARGWFFTTKQGCFTGDHHIGGDGLGGLNLDDGTFHHFACVKEGAAYREYIDGTLIAEDAGPTTGTAVGEPVQIGSINTGTCSPSSAELSGLVDEVTLYNRALNTSEIQAIFDAGSAGKCKCDPNAPIEVNGYELRGHQNTWIRYIASDVVPHLQGSRAQKIESAATVAWWALKEGVLSQSDPHGFSLCSWPGRGDIPLRPIQTCPDGRAWQVGLAGVQVPNYSDLQVWLATNALYPTRSTAEILGEAAVLAGFHPNRGPTYAAIVSSEGTLQRSWLLRHPVVGVTMQAPVVTSECVVGSASWCYRGHWVEARRYAPDRDGALQSIEDLTSALECLAP